jgi:hypothetical protein
MSAGGAGSQSSFRAFVTDHGFSDAQKHTGEVTREPADRSTCMTGSAPTPASCISKGTTADRTRAHNDITRFRKTPESAQSEIPSISPSPSIAVQAVDVPIPQGNREPAHPPLRLSEQVSASRTEAHQGSIDTPGPSVVSHVPGSPASQNVPSAMKGASLLSQGVATDEPTGDDQNFAQSISDFPRVTEFAGTSAAEGGDQTQKVQDGLVAKKPSVAAISATSSRTVDASSLTNGRPVKEAVDWTSPHHQAHPQAQGDQVSSDSDAQRPEVRVTRPSIHRSSAAVSSPFEHERESPTQSREPTTIKTGPSQVVHTELHQSAERAPDTATVGSRATQDHPEPVTLQRATKSTGETFAAMDSAPASPVVWSSHGVNKAEAGFQDPTLGWVRVRAQSDSAGVHATVVPASTSAGQALSAHLSGLETYLIEGHTHLDSWGVAAPESLRGAASDFGPGTQTMGHSGEGKEQSRGQPESSVAATTPESRLTRGPGREPVASQVQRAGVGRYVSLMA